MSNLPHLKFIKTLIAHKDDFNTVNEELAKVLLPPLATQDYRHIYDEMYNKHADYFDDISKPLESLLWDFDITELFSSRYNYALNSPVEMQRIADGMPGAIKILNDPLMRRAIQALSIAGNVPEEDIELIINGKYDITYISENFSLFIKYFFDIKNWTLAQKRDYVQKLHPTQRSFKEAYVYALQGDKNYLLWKLGLAPDKSFDQMLRDMMVDSYYNFKEQTGSNAESALKWGTLMAKISDRLDKIDKEDDTKVNLYNSISFQLKQDEAYNTIIDQKERSKRKIEVPTVDMGDSPDITTLENLTSNSNNEDEQE